MENRTGKGLIADLAPTLKGGRSLVHRDMRPLLPPVQSYVVDCRSVLVASVQSSFVTQLDSFTCIRHNGGS